MLLQTLIKQSMKTVTLIISSLFLFMVLGVSAQQHGPQHRGQRGHVNPEELVKRQVEHMKTELKLNEQQEKQVKDLLTENFKQRGELMKKYQGQRDSVMVNMKKMEEQLKEFRTLDNEPFRLLGFQILCQTFGICQDLIYIFFRCNLIHCSSLLISHHGIITYSRFSNVPV